MSELLPSLPTLATRLAREREQLQRHADAIDTKAGVALGIAAVFTALGLNDGLWIATARCFAAASALCCLASLYPRPFASLEVLALRDQYLTAPIDITALDLLDTDIEMHRSDARKLRTKVRFLTVGVGGLGVAIVLGVVGILY